MKPLHIVSEQSRHTIKKEQVKIAGAEQKEIFSTLKAEIIELVNTDKKGDKDLDLDFSDV